MTEHKQDYNKHDPKQSHSSAEAKTPYASTKTDHAGYDSKASGAQAVAAAASSKRQYPYPTTELVQRVANLREMINHTDGVGLTGPQTESVIEHLDWIECAVKDVAGIAATAPLPLPGPYSEGGPGVLK